MLKSHATSERRNLDRNGAEQRRRGAETKQSRDGEDQSRRRAETEKRRGRGRSGTEQSRGRRKGKNWQSSVQWTLNARAGICWRSALLYRERATQLSARGDCRHAYAAKGAHLAPRTPLTGAAHARNCISREREQRRLRGALQARGVYEYVA